MNTGTGTLKKIRKDLKKYVFEYLNDFDKISIYFTHKTLREHININLGFLETFKYLIKLGNINSKEEFINIYNELYIEKLILDKFTKYSTKNNVNNNYNKNHLFKNTKYDDIINSIGSYFIYNKNKFSKNKIIMNIFDISDLIRWNDILEKIRNENFIIYPKNMGIQNLFNTDNDIIDKIEEEYKMLFIQILRKIKLINFTFLNEKMGTQYFNFINEFDIEINIQNLNGDIIFDKNNLNFCVKYFEKFPNHLSELKISLKNTLENFKEIILLNKDSLKKIKLRHSKNFYKNINDEICKLYLIIKSCVNLEELEIFEDKSNIYSSNINNTMQHFYQLNKISTFNSNNFKLINDFSLKNSVFNLKEIGGLKIEESKLNQAAFILNRLFNLEKINNIEFGFTDEKLIVRFFNSLSLQSLKYIKMITPILYDDDSEIIMKLINSFSKFENLSSFLFFNSQLNYDENFNIENVINFPNFKKFNGAILNFTIKLLKNSMHKTYQFNITCLDNRILSIFINSIYKANEFEILNKIDNIKISRSYNNHTNERKITKHLKKLHSINIPSYIDFKSFKDIKIIKEISIGKIFMGSNHNNNEFFEFLKNSQVYFLKIAVDDNLSVLRFILTNIESFTNLKFFEITDSIFSINYMKENFCINDSYIPLIDLIMNFNFLSFRIKIGSKYSFKRINCIEEINENIIQIN